MATWICNQAAIPHGDALGLGQTPDCARIVSKHVHHPFCCSANCTAKCSGPIVMLVRDLLLRGNVRPKFRLRATFLAEEEEPEAEYGENEIKRSQGVGQTWTSNFCFLTACNVNTKLKRCFQPHGS